MKRMNLFFILSLILLLNTNAYSEFNSLGSNSLFPVDFLNDVYIFDENTVMTVGSVGTILNTYNGGANWLNSIIDPVYDMRGIQFLNINTGWMQSNFYGQILKTTNGGSNWLNLAQTAGPFYFINENTGWTSYSNAGIEIRILKTTNGGINWTSQYNISDNYYPNSVYFGDSNTGYVLGFNNGNDSKIIKTTNSGVNWIVQPLINNSLNTFYFINSNTGWAAGRDGAILRTTNAGNNWFTQNSGTNGGLRRWNSLTKIQDGLAERIVF